MQETILISKPKQLDKTEILNEEDRLFKAWGSVEVRDVDGDLLPMSEFKKIMPLIADRGGVIMDSHSNRQVAKMINYEFKEHDSGKEGVLLTCKVFKNYSGDDEVWEEVKSGNYTGLSFGGRSSSREVKFEKGMEVTNILRGIEGYEFSLVKSPANKSALITEVNYLAKSDSGEKQKMVSFIELEISKQEEIIKELVEKLAKEGIEWAAETIKTETFNPENSSDKFIKNSEVNINMVESKETKKEGGFNEAPNNSAPAPMENGVEERLAKLEQAVAQILEMVQTPMNNKSDKSEEDDKEEDDVEKEGNGETKVLPKDVSEKVDEMDAGEGAEKDKVKLVEKELMEIKKEFSEFKNSFGKSTTPRPGSDKFINKGDVTNKIKSVSSWNEAHQLTRGKR